MAAIVTDQFRILNASNFVDNVTDSNNSYYVFVGLSNPTTSGFGRKTDFNTDTPSPTDNINYMNFVGDNMSFGKKVTSDNVRRLVREISWSRGTKYEMYRHDYNIYNLTPITSQGSLYEANYYIVNEDLKVYICLQNGSDPENPKGRPSYDQPTFVDLEPRAAGTSGDGYVWKYLYTIKPSEIVKFDSIEYIPVPENWGKEGETIATKANAIDGKIEVVVVDNRGSNYQPISTSFANVPILGDGSGGKATITVDSFGKVSEVFVTDGGEGYTHGSIQFFPGAPGSESGGVLANLTNTGIGTTSAASFSVIIPPKGGHGYDVYRELGAYRALLYSRFETIETNPDIIEGNDFARVGLIKNPTVFGSSTELLDTAMVSGLKAIKMAGLTTGTTYAVDSEITQTVGLGSTAIGYVASWDKVTGVLKYYQPMGLASSETGYKIIPFTSNPDPGYGVTINGSSVTGSLLSVDTSYNGVSTSINNKVYQLGMSFSAGISSAEFNTKSGEIIYIDNRTAIPRSASQKEDIKIVLEF